MQFVIANSLLKRTTSSADKLLTGQYNQVFISSCLDCSVAIAYF